MRLPLHPTATPAPDAPEAALLPPGSLDLVSDFLSPEQHKLSDTRILEDWKYMRPFIKKNLPTTVFAVWTLFMVVSCTTDNHFLPEFKDLGIAEAYVNANPELKILLLKAFKDENFASVRRLRASVYVPSGHCC